MGYNSIKFVLFLQTFFRLRRSVQENPAPAPLPQLPACIKGRLVRRSVMSVSFNSIFLYTSVLHRDKSRTHFYALGLSDGQPKVLNHLLRHEGVSQKELAEYRLVRPATMTGSAAQDDLRRACLPSKSACRQRKARLWNFPDRCRAGACGKGCANA